jgi:hypothetical protein
MMGADSKSAADPTVAVVSERVLFDINGVDTV